MAENIVINGTTYENVESITVKNTNGEDVTFTLGGGSMAFMSEQLSIENVFSRTLELFQNNSLLYITVQATYNPIAMDIKQVFINSDEQGVSDNNIDIIGTSPIRLYPIKELNGELFLASGFYNGLALKITPDFQFASYVETISDGWSFNLNGSGLLNLADWLRNGEVIFTAYYLG